MLSSTPNYPRTTVPGLEVNTLWGGLFHAVTYVATVMGLCLLWSAARPRAPWWTKRLVGLLLIGWGTFNLVEGVVDHHLLGLRHVNETVPVEAAGDLGSRLPGLGARHADRRLDLSPRRGASNRDHGSTPPTNGRPGVPALLVLGHLIGGERRHVADLALCAMTGLGLLIGITHFLRWSLSR